jgi:inosine/xanthosine triphosphate pyrophosphatase family protein
MSNLRPETEGLEARFWTSFVVISYLAVLCVVELAGKGEAAARPTNDNNATWDIFMVTEDNSASLTTREKNGVRESNKIISISC